MSLLISIPAALLGSILGSAVRGAVAATNRRDESSEEEAVISVSISPVAGVVGGVAGSVLGPGTAFWVGAVLGAAGMDRLDARLLAHAGIDLDALVARGLQAADEARKAASGARTTAPATTEEPD